MFAVPKRIIPVASGKGGVGKTTFAINFALALSRRAPTVLVDLDTGTSSVRTTLSTPVRRDLYHFHRKGTPLSDCITPLDGGLDGDGEFRNFGFVAGPLHFIADLAQPDATFRRRVAAEINTLPADYVVVDLRAGLDENVLDFLPYTNSGVLVFTPHHPTATLAASDIVKAILFRTLRLIFAPGSAVFSLPGMADSHDLIKELLEVTEDVYDESIPNLDALIKDMRDVFGPQPLLDVITDVLEDFRVHYVLNMFNGVQEGYERTLKPFVENVARNVSARPTLTQLGWVVEDERIHQANCSGRPILLDRRQIRKRPAAEADPVMAELEALASSMLGISRRPRRAPALPASVPTPVAPERLDPTELLDAQLASLKAMYSDRSNDTVRENFSYLVFRALNLIAPPRAPSEFGQTAVAQPEQIQRWFMRRQAV
ncbi:MAG: P-loop NTPase [Holophagales bacterium]|nr:MAG: P-loop NTPase [Holophagales bacterium]